MARGSGLYVLERHSTLFLSLLILILLTLGQSKYRQSIVYLPYDQIFLSFEREHFIQIICCGRATVTGSTAGIQEGYIRTCTTINRLHFDMASWAQVAGTGRPKYVSKPSPGPAVKEVLAPQANALSAQNRKTTKVGASKCVAVPSIPTQTRPAQATPVSPSRTASTSVTSQQNTSGSSSMTTPSPAKPTNQGSKQTDRPASSSWEYNVYGMSSTRWVDEIYSDLYPVGDS